MSDDLVVSTYIARLEAAHAAQREALECLERLVAAAGAVKVYDIVAVETLP